MSAPAPVRTMISPGRYVQARGALARLGEFLAPLGSTPLVVADDQVWKLVEDDVRASLAAADLPVTRTGMGVFATAAEVDRVVGEIRAAGADVCVAVAAAAPSTRSRPPDTSPASGGRPCRPSPPRTPRARHCR